MSCERRSSAVVVSRPTAIVVTGPGTNRDRDAMFALDLAGAEPVTVPVGQLAAQPDQLDEARIVLVAGGFSYGDALGAGTDAGARPHRRRRRSAGRCAPSLRGQLVDR